MLQDQVCPRCGRPLHDDAPRGLCPACLLMAVLREQDARPFPVCMFLGRRVGARGNPRFFRSSWASEDQPKPGLQQGNGGPGTPTREPQ